MNQEHTSVLYGGISLQAALLYAHSPSEQFFYLFIFKTSLVVLVFQNGDVCLSTSVLKVADVKIGPWEIPYGRCYSDRRVYFALLRADRSNVLTHLKGCWSYNNKLSH